MPRGHLIYNPSAGQQSPEEPLRETIQLFQERGWELKIFGSESPQHLTQLAQKASEENADAVFIAGGDGSINRVAAGLIQSNTALGVLPAGSSNVLAQNLNLPYSNPVNSQKLRQAAAMLLDGSLHSIDIGLCNAHPFVLWAGVGIDGRAVERMEHQRKQNKSVHWTFNYILGTIQEAWNWPGMNVKLIHHDRVDYNHSIMIVCCNTRTYAGGLANLAPTACLNDGILNVWDFSGNRFSHVVAQAMSLIFLKQPLKYPPAREFLSNHLEILLNEVEYCHVDGEPIGLTNRVEIKLIPKALKLLTPKNVTPGLIH